VFFLRRPPHPRFVTELQIDEQEKVRVVFSESVADLRCDDEVFRTVCTYPAPQDRGDSSSRLQVMNPQWERSPPSARNQRNWRHLPRSRGISDFLIANPPPWFRDQRSPCTSTSYPGVRPLTQSADTGGLIGQHSTDDP